MRRIFLAYLSVRSSGGGGTQTQPTPHIPNQSMLHVGQQHEQGGQLGFNYDSAGENAHFQRGILVTWRWQLSLIITHGAVLQCGLFVRRRLRRGTARGEEAEQRSCID